MSKLEDKILAMLDYRLAELGRVCRYCGMRSPKAWDEKHECCAQCSGRVAA